jgi:L-threonylcarbamoyladenylate synthase
MMHNRCMSDEQMATLTHVVARPEDIARAIQILREGGVIALPTDTVYGIAASLDHPAAIERLFTIKGRAGTKAIPVLVSDAAAVRRLSTGISDEAERLVNAFWPGGLTVVVDAGPDIPDEVLRDGTTVGLRMPDNADALAVIAGAGGALAVTSANRSGDADAHSAAEVRAALGDRIDFVLDGGPSSNGPASTVIDATQQPVRVLRVGAIDVGRVLAVARSGSQ